MLVRTIRNEEEKRWDIVALSGPLYGATLAKADSFRLADGRFQYGSMTGYLVSYQGDALVTDPSLQRAEEMGQSTPSYERTAAYDYGTTSWFDDQSKEDLRFARFIAVIGDNITYATDDDIQHMRKRRG